MIDKNSSRETLKDRGLKNGVLSVVTDVLLDWDNKGTQGKIETDVTRVIEKTINYHMSEYFNERQVHFIAGNFTSSENFLSSFYNANPDIGSIVNEAIYEVVAPIQLILDGVRLEKPLYYYFDWFDIDLKILQYFSNDYTRQQKFNELISKKYWLTIIKGLYL